MQSADIIVVGGRLRRSVFCSLSSEIFPRTFQPPSLVVLHVSPDTQSHTTEIINQAGPLLAAFARNEEKIIASRIYVAPPDQDLLVCDGTIRLTRDPRENRSRPAIDPL